MQVTQFYQAFPALVLQVTNTEVRRPGYEARGGGTCMRKLLACTVYVMHAIGCKVSNELQVSLQL